MKQHIFILLSVPVLENTSSAIQGSMSCWESARNAAGLDNSMNGRHPWLARCQDGTRDNVNTTLKRAHCRHSDRGFTD